MEVSHTHGMPNLVKPDLACHCGRINNISHLITNKKPNSKIMHMHDNMFCMTCGAHLAMYKDGQIII